MSDTQTLPKFSIAIGGTKKATNATANPLKRSHASLLEDDEDEQHSKKVQTVTHFDRKSGGAFDENKPKDKGPLVIKPQSNRDWKEAGRQRRQQSTLPSQEDQAQRIAAIEAAEKRERERAYGLNVMRPSAAPAAATDEVDEPNTEAPQERTADERAMDALLGIEQESSLVVPAMTEDDAFHQDSRNAPDGPTLDDYARVPVEEYGAAMLRGMGWKGGKSKATKIPERRPAMLGVGAKPDAAISAELGGWGKAARGKEPVIYNPVVRKDPKTGELFTDAELQKRQEQDQRRKYEEEFEKQEKKREQRKRYDDDDHDSKDRRHRDRRQRSDREGSRDRSERHRSDRDSDRQHSKRERSKDRYERHRSERDRPRSDRNRSKERHRRHESDDRRKDDRRYADRDRSSDRHRDRR